MSETLPPGSPNAAGFWIDDNAHRRWLADAARDLLTFFSTSRRSGGGFHVLDVDGSALPDSLQELHTTTRLVHSYVLGKRASLTAPAVADAIIDQGMAYLTNGHRDARFGGYLWARDDAGIRDDRKLAYGHVFVLLAGASALMVGHPAAQSLIDDVDAVLDAHFWDDDAGLFTDEWNRDWSPFSDYRGMNANMHGVEALLAAFEATGRERYLQRAGRILDFFMRRMAPSENWRLPEHYTADWRIDRDYAGNPMFRPAGTTPGHSVELARLLLQYWDLVGRPDNEDPAIARQVIEQAFSDAWDTSRGGGLVYTLRQDGTPHIRDRYWWPVTEAIGAVAALIKFERNVQHETRYRELWTFAASHFIDWQHGGWYPEIGDDNQPTSTQFTGKPDIYHALQACLFPLVPSLSRIVDGLSENMPSAAKVSAPETKTTDGSAAP